VIGGDRLVILKRIEVGFVHWQQIKGVEVGKSQRSITVAYISRVGPPEDTYDLYHLERLSVQIASCCSRHHRMSS
jgi:hypothetical protein